MPEYRIYSCNGEGHIVGAKELLAANDEIAVAVAEQLLDGLDLEVWEGARTVKKLASPTLARHLRVPPDKELSED